MQTKLIRDVPIGVLLIVLGFFCVYFVQYLAGFPTLLPLLGILFSSIAANRLVNVGLDVIVGIEVSDKK